MKTLFKDTGSDARKTRWGVLGSSLAAIALLAAPLVIDIGTQGASGLIDSAQAAPKLCDDGTRPPCNGGGGGGAAPDFGDLIKLYRDTSGVPYLTADSCWQPLPSDTCDTSVCTLVDGVPSGVDVVPVDPDTCAVAAACATCTQEVDFGRINEARSPDEVFASQLEDVVVSLATADCVTLDPAGRLVASSVDDTTLDNLAKTIDSPLQNLAIYRELILTGFIGTDPGIPLPGETLVTAARGLGAASDKAGEVDVDLVAYLNQIMGLSDPLTLTTLDPKICIERKQEVQGVVQLVQECFLDYSAYGYARTANFSLLPSPAYIPADVPVNGTFEYLVQLDDVPTFGIEYGLITTAVFEDEPGDEAGNIGGFAQASDDARAVIQFMHENQVPVDFETPVPCVASGDIFYDLSISEQSGLQVPTNYINTKEREFFLNVANLGPDAANGTATVVATANDGGTLGSWTFSFTDLPSGQTASYTQLFTFTTTSPTINWTATAVADGPGTDPNPGNNEVTATSTVKATGGGGRP